MSLFLCLNCLSSNRTTKNSIQSQKAKTGIWQQFKKFFVGIKNLKTYVKSVVSGNGAYSKETGKSMAGLALNTLTVESRSKESLNLISNSENKFYAKAAKECKKKDEGYLKAIQTATNPEFLNAKEKSVKNNSTRGTHHTSIQSGDNHTLVPNPSSSVSSNTPESSTGATIVNNSRTISPASEGAQKAVQTIYSDSPPEELKTLVVTNEDLLDNINHLFERGGELPKPYLVEYNCGGISKKRKEEINEIRSEFKELNEIPHSNTTPQQKLKLNELSEKIKNFNEKEKDYNSLIDNSCSESTMALAYQILTGKELRFRGNLDFTKLTLNGEKDFQTDLGLLFDACEGKQNEKYFKSLKFEENRENDLKSELDSFNYPLLLIRTGNGGGHQSGHYKVLLKKNDSWYELNPGADKELQKRQLTSQSELATDVGKDLLRSNFKVIPYTPQCLYAQLILTQDFRTKSQEDIDFIIVTRIDEIKNILSKE